MSRRYRWLLIAILAITLLTTLGSRSSLIAKAQETHANTKKPYTVGGVFPSCGPAYDGEIILVGGNRYICQCVFIIAGQPCSWVWKNLDAVSYTYLEMDQGVLITNGPKAKLYFQPDNNLVVYDEYGHARWASNTVGKANKVIFQLDGNFVAYNGSGQPTWASNTCCWNGNTLHVQTDGNVVIYTSFGYPLWSTNTSH